MLAGDAPALRRQATARPAPFGKDMTLDQQTDRYVSFKNIDCDGKTRAVMARIEQHVTAGDNPFWDYFRQQRELAHGRGLDDLRVLHNYLPTLRELLDDLDDQETLDMLEELERICM